jgi:cysteine desulfurase family protein (TIGR01976 family)
MTADRPALPFPPGAVMLDVSSIRQQFPALHRVVAGRTPVFLDGPGGTQVPRRVIDAVAGYLETCNANHGGPFTTSRESDALLDAAHQAVADLLNAPSPREVVFGQNMTSLTLHVSRSLARTLQPGDAVVVTRLDHDANVRPWALAARDAGAEVRFVDVRPEDGTLDLEDLERQLQGRVRLLALSCASNAIGTMPDVAAVVGRAHAAGALVYLDAVHYAPHGLIDVRAWDCDFLACSAYKFFGPHVGILWGRTGLLEALPAYKVKPAPEALPDRWMTGTQNHEGIAGVTAAVEYLASLGAGETRRERLASAMAAIREYETGLVRLLLAGLKERRGCRIWGPSSDEDLPRRAPTVAFTHATKDPEAVARHLAGREIYSWAGNFYALELAERLGVEARGGFLRLGLVHYNTAQEVERLFAALDEL